MSVGKTNINRERRARSGREAFSLIEVTILALLLLVAVGGLSGAVLSSMRLARVTEESALADEAARGLAARMQVTDFGSIFAAYNGFAGDDPVGITSPGAAFDVRGLTPRRDDLDGRVGRIVFPTVELVGGALALREDVLDARLGMENGRDLNGNGTATDDVTFDYQLLPARVIVEWTGAAGNRSYELDLVMAE
jgi:hypothetical protein